MGKDYATMSTAALQHRNCFLMGKLGRARRGKLQAPPEKVEAWRREAAEVTEELLRRARRGYGLPFFGDAEIEKRACLPAQTQIFKKGMC